MMLTEVWSELKQGHNPSRRDEDETQEDHIVHVDVSCACANPVSAILPFRTLDVLSLVSLSRRFIRNSWLSRLRVNQVTHPHGILYSTGD